jgi:hypothetical protein
VKNPFIVSQNCKGKKGKVFKGKKGREQEAAIPLTSARL